MEQSKKLFFVGNISIEGQSEGDRSHHGQNNTFLTLAFSLVSNDTKDNKKKKRLTAIKKKKLKSKTEAKYTGKSSSLTKQEDGEDSQVRNNKTRGGSLLLFL